MKTPTEILTETLNSEAIFTEDERAQAREEIRLKDEREYREFVERSWLDLCPCIYNEPIDYSKIKPETNHSKIRMLVEWPAYPRGVFVIGPTGRGKTRACWTALKTKFLEGKSIKHATSFQLAQDALRSTTDADAGKFVMGRYIRPGILFLDDLGKRLTPSAIQFLFEVIERRTSEGMAIIATSNETLSTLSDSINDPTIADPIIRRIREFCDVTVLP